LRILLADDHPINRKVIELMLAGTGADLTTVENGEEALAAYTNDRFDLVLMDMQMPVMDGLTAVRRIRGLEAERGEARVPIIMLTANAMQEHIEASHAAGADHHLGKPITPEGLFSSIDQVLCGQPLAASRAAV
jgi:CheY-like chemotaxis protein